MKEFKINLLWSNVIQDAIRERAFSFWLAFLHNDETCSLKINSWSTSASSNFSYLLLTVSLPIFIWKIPLVLFMSKWCLSAFTFILLSLNHSGWIRKDKNACVTKCVLQMMMALLKTHKTSSMDTFYGVGYLKLNQKK